jgi:hypothetical protein
MLSKLQQVGTAIKDGQGRIWQLQGVEGQPKPLPVVGNRWRLKPEDVDWIAGRNTPTPAFNSLRLWICWHDYEVSPGVFDESYLTEYVDPIVDAAERNGLYVVLCNFVSRMSPWFAPAYGAYGEAYGVPQFYANTYPQTDEGMTQFAYDFWDGVGQGGEAKTAMVEFWRRLASHYAGRGAVIAAYELFNEPLGYRGMWIARMEQYQKVFEYYENQLMSAIRSVDPHTMVIYDADHDYPDCEIRPTYSNVIYGTGIYKWRTHFDGHVYNRTEDYEKLRSIFVWHKQVANSFGTTYMCTEFGGGNYEDPGMAEYMEDLVKICKELRLGWLYHRYVYPGNDAMSIRYGDASPYAGNERPMVEDFRTYYQEPTPTPPIIPIIVGAGLGYAVGREPGAAIGALAGATLGSVSFKYRERLTRIGMLGRG